MNLLVGCRCGIFNNSATKKIEKFGVIAGIKNSQEGDKSNCVWILFKDGSVISHKLEFIQISKEDVKRIMRERKKIVEKVTRAQLIDFDD